MHTTCCREVKKEAIRLWLSSAMPYKKSTLLDRSCSITSKVLAESQREHNGICFHPMLQAPQGVQACRGWGACGSR